MKNILLAIALVAAFTGCKSLSVTTVMDYKKDVDFKTYKTYSFYPGKFVTDTVSENRKAAAQKVFKEDVSTYLNKKGLKQDDKNPDVIITFIAGATNKKELEAHSPSDDPGQYGPWKPMGEGGEGFWQNEYREGTLVIGMYDVKARQFVWGTYSTTTIYTADGDKKFRAAIKKSFNRFPPQ